MKKILFTLAIASAFLSSCNNDYYVPLPEEANNLIGTEWKCDVKNNDGNTYTNKLQFIDNKSVVSNAYINGELIFADTLGYHRCGTLDHKEDLVSIYEGIDTNYVYYPNMESGTMKEFFKGTDTNIINTPEHTYKRIK